MHRELRDGAVAGCRRPSCHLHECAELRLNCALRRIGWSARRRRHRPRSSLRHHLCEYRLLLDCMDRRGSQPGNERHVRRAPLQPGGLRHLLHRNGPARHNRRDRLRHHHGLWKRPAPLSLHRLWRALAPHQRKPSAGSGQRRRRRPQRRQHRLRRNGHRRLRHTGRHNLRLYQLLEPARNRPAECARHHARSRAADAHRRRTQRHVARGHLWPRPLADPAPERHHDSGAGYHALFHQPHLHGAGSRNAKYCTDDHRHQLRQPARNLRHARRHWRLRRDRQLRGPDTRDRRHLHLQHQLRTHDRPALAPASSLSTRTSPAARRRSASAEPAQQPQLSCSRRSR